MTAMLPSQTITAALFPDNRWSAAAHDGSGNLTSFAGRTFVYDGDNRLVSATVNGATADYVYDGEGRRVRKTDAFGTTTFVYDAAGQLAAEYFAAAAGATQPAEQEPGTRWVFADHLGSTRATLGSGGAGLKLFDYAPFGEDLARAHNGRGPEYPAELDVPGNVAQRFTGKERGAETGLDYFGARYMSAAQGRFTSPDAPFVDQHAADPQSWNLYSYVRNNPLRNIDVNGRQAQPAVRLVAFLEKYEAQLAQAAKALMSAKEIHDVGKALRDLFAGTSTVSDKIDAQLQSADLGTRVSGLIGAVLENKFGSDVIDVGREVRDASGRRVGEIDYELTFANVEVKSGAHPVNMAQLETLTDNKDVNPTNLLLVVYAPQATPNQTKQIQSTGAIVVRNSVELIKTLERIKEEKERSR